MVMMTSYSKISVIIPTIGRIDSLRNCLNGLSKMKYPQEYYEIIVVNDGGAYLNREKIGFNGRLRSLQILNQPNKGPASARNAGALKAGGDYLAFIDDDCIPSSNWLEVLEKRIAIGDDCAVGGRTVNMLTENPFATTSQMMVDHIYGVMNKKPEMARFLATNNLAVPKDRFIEMGGFNGSFVHAAGEDRDFCRRWIHNGYPMVYLPDAVVFHAHNLTFTDYLCQHFTYGQGAFRYHWVTNPGHFQRLETLSYYWNLLLFPLRKQGVPGKPFLTLLMAISQAATAAGIVYGLCSKPLSSW